MAANLTAFGVSALAVGLRVGPIFAFAPPFTLTRTPVIVRVLLGLGLSATLVAGLPSGTLLTHYDAESLLAVAARELLIGVTILTPFQLMFGTLYMAGRTLDIQAGFGLAVLIDPTSQAQTPLIGTLFAYLAGATFFTMGGAHDLLRLIAASLQAAPLGEGRLVWPVTRLAAFMTAALASGLGIAGGAISCLFLVDAAVALLSRTVPQMNVLVLGFQVKTLVLLTVLPMSFGVSGALLLRLTAETLALIPRLL